MRWNRQAVSSLSRSIDRVRGTFVYGLVCRDSTIFGSIDSILYEDAGSILSLDQVVSYSIVQELGVTLESQALHDSIFVERDRPRLQIQYCRNLLH